MSTSDPERSGPAPRVVRGAWRALLLAALGAPVLVPLAVPKSVLVVAPWLASTEAAQQERLVLLEADVRARAMLDAVVSSGSGIVGVCGIAVLASVLLGLLARRVARRERTSVLAQAPLVPLACLAFGVAAGALVVAAGGHLGRRIDVATSVQPTSPWSLGLLFANEAFALAVAGACVGAAFAAAECRGLARGAALAVVGLGCAVGLAVQSRAAHGLVERLDVGLSLEDALGGGADASPVTVVATTRGRAWSVPISRAVGGTGVAPSLAVRARERLARTGGRTSVAVDAERYVMTERLLAFDPAGARDAAMQAVLLRGSEGATRALLSSLGACAPTARTRALLARLDSAPELAWGPSALGLLANAHAHHGDREAAQATLARVRSFASGEDLVQSRDQAPFVVSDVVDGVVTGRLLVDGQPWLGRVALMRMLDLFDLPEDDVVVPATWLLRLGAVARTDGEGRFRFENVVGGEHVLLLVAGPGALDTPRASPAPAIVVTSEEPHVALGTIALDWIAPEVAAQ